MPDNNLREDLKALGYDKDAADELASHIEGNSPSSAAAESYSAPLFEGRTPEAAAQQLATVLAWATECELATLARYERLKSSSKSETERHREICDRLVRHCAELGVQPNGLSGKKCPRLKERLEEYGAE